MIRVAGRTIRMSHRIRVRQSRGARDAARVEATVLGAAGGGRALPVLRMRELAGKRLRPARAKIWSRIHMNCSRLITAMGHRTTAILRGIGGAAVTRVGRVGVVWVPEIDIPSRVVLAPIPVQINVAIPAGKGKSAAMTVAREMKKTAVPRSRIP